MTRRRQPLLLGAVLALALAASPAQAKPAPLGDQQLSPNPTAEHVDAYGGDLVYTRRLDDDSWALVARVGGKIGDIAGVPRSPQSFFADLGPGATGGVDAVYFRCATKSIIGCPLERLALATGKERAIPLPPRPAGCNFSSPAVFKATVAMAVNCGKHPDSLSVRYAGRWRTVHVFGGKEGSGPGSLDLSANQLVAVTYGDLNVQLVSVAAHGGALRVLYRDTGPAYDVGASIDSPTIAGSWVYFASSDSGEDGHFSGVQRVPAGGQKDPTAGQSETALHFTGDDRDRKENQLGVLDSMAFDGGDLFYVVEQDTDSDPDPADPLSPGLFRRAKADVHFTSF